MAERYDAVVVGSGFGGAVVALRLAEDGRRVIVLERGRRLGVSDLRQSRDVRYISSLYASPRSRDGATSFRSARTVGGGSVLFSGAMLRAPSAAFDFEPDRRRLWPEELGRAELDPWYAVVEEALGVRRILWDEVPKAGGAFARMCASAGLRCDRIPFCYEGCRQCGWCSSGCIFDSKTTLVDTYIPAAEALGAVVRTGAEAHRIEPTWDGRYSVQYGERTGALAQVEGDQVFLAGGSVATPAILLRSARALPGISEQVGRNLSSNGALRLFVETPEGEPSVECYQGRENGGVILYEHWDEHRVTFVPGPHPLALFGAEEVHPPDVSPFGLEHKRWVERVFPHRIISGTCNGLVPGEGRVTLDDEGRPEIELELTPALRAHEATCQSLLESVVGQSGGRVLETASSGFRHDGTQALGSCRMADDAQTGACDRNGELFGREGLFVVDGSSLPGPLGVSPALTIAANAERIAATVVGSR